MPWKPSERYAIPFLVFVFGWFWGSGAGLWLGVVDEVEVFGEFCLGAEGECDASWAGVDRLLGFWLSRLRARVFTFTFTFTFCTKNVRLLF